MEEKKNITEKENFTVRNILDNDGHSETAIMEESEIFDAVEKWLEENSFQDLMKKEGVLRTGQSFGNRVEVQIDVRDGRITCCTEYQNQYSTADSFFITLASTPEFDISDDDLLEGASTAKITLDQLKKAIDTTDPDDIADFIEMNDLEQEDDGTYIVYFWQVHEVNYEINAETWINEYQDCDETYEEILSNHIDWLLEDAGDNYIENIHEYYQDLRNTRNQRWAE